VAQCERRRTADVGRELEEARAARRRIKLKRHVAAQHCIVWQSCQAEQSRTKANVQVP
jgi:hypothetical protein